MQSTRPEVPKIAYSIKEAVAATSLSRTTIYAKIAAKELRAVRIGGRTVIPAEALYDMIGAASPEAGAA